MMPGDPVVGSTILRRPAVQSPNFTTGVSGWTINADGSAEFNNLTIRGTFDGTDFEVSANGAFFYSAAPAAGNLAYSITTAAGTDSFGNHYLSGATSYSGPTAMQSDSGLISMYSGSLAAGWGTATAQILLSGAGIIGLIGGGGVVTSNNTLDDGAGGAVFGGAVAVGALTVGGTDQTSTNGLPNGGTTGTSGGASAGTAHTHGPGSYSVSNGQHHHTL
jgi:hypothetical protein